MSVMVESLPAHQNNQVVNTATETPEIKMPENDEDTRKTTEKTITPEVPRMARVQPLVYTKEELFAFKEDPLSRIRPHCLSDKYCNRDGIWDPELWYYSEESEKRSASPIDSKKKFLLDGIVLSPQGRSFARGCQVTQGKDGKNKTSGRVGRGYDPRERGGLQKGRTSPAGDSRFERNSKTEKYNGPGRNRRARSGSYESQPEWFTHGPSSQQDTIELRGFTEGEIENKRKKRKKESVEASSNQKHQNTDGMVDENKMFDINEFFDMAENALPISEMFDNQVNSRGFSQWFHSEGRSRSVSFNANPSNSRSNSRRSSITEELAEIAGLTLSSPVRTPTPDPEFLFAPIIPAADPRHEDPELQDVLEKSEFDVQPLLDSVIPHKTVKGAMNLEDIEGEQSVKFVKPEEKKTEAREKVGSAAVFTKLVETMKACGNLPDKPTPTIPDIPPHLLPRPPSAKDKSRTVSPRLSRSRSPSPLQLLQEVIRRTQSPVGFVGNPSAPAVEPRLVSPFEVLRSASPVADMFAAANLTRPFTPEELYGAPPVFNIDAGAGTNLFEFTGSNPQFGNRSGIKGKPNLPRYTTNSQPNSEQNTSVASVFDDSRQKPTNTRYPVISKAFVPTSVLRKIHSEKHDQKLSNAKENEKKPAVPSRDMPIKTSAHLVAPQRQPLFEVSNSIGSSTSRPSDSSRPLDSSRSLTINGRSNLMSPHEFTSPKSTMASGYESSEKPEILTPHRLPLPGSPTIMTPHSLPLPHSPLVRQTPSKPAMNTRQRLLTPHSLPLPHSPLVNGATATSTMNGPSNFGIRPLPKRADDGQRIRVRTPAAQDIFKRPLNQSVRHNISGNNMWRFPQSQVPLRGQTPQMVGRPGLVPNPYTANIGRGLNVHPTALALALRNQQYQMARAAAVAAATAAVNRPPMMTPAQAVAAALILNQQRATMAASHGFLPSASPRMFQQRPLRPNLPPALQHQHHVVHRSDYSKDSSLSKWFSDAVLTQSQTKPASPGRGAKVLSVEELERHA